MNTLIWITNIPTPYRNHRYKMMRDILPEYGLHFEVLFMARTEPGRHWKFEPDDLDYPHRFLTGPTIRANGMNLYFNSRLLSHMRRSRPDIVLVGGYSAPTLLAAPFLCPKGTIRLLGVESNLASAKHNAGPISKLKRAIVSRYDGFIIPGLASQEYIENLDPEAVGKPFIALPNTIQSEWGKITDREPRNADALRDTYGLRPDQQLWFCAARLEKFKGLAEFLPGMEGIENVQLIIAGEGGERDILQRLLDRHSLPVRLIGHLDAELMRRHYEAADLFILPSLKEPYGLVVVEAASFGLPLVLTKAVGASYELLTDAENGWIIDGVDRDSTRRVIQTAAATSRTQLARMGRRSREAYNARFNGEAAIRNLAEELTRLVTSRNGRR